jgi:uridine kinase
VWGWSLDPSWAARVLGCEPRVGPVRLVCIDGPAGSGKTSLAGELAAALVAARPELGEVPVVHGDEVYEGWDVVAAAPDRVHAFGLLAGRLDAWLLAPWREGRSGRHPAWDWHDARWGDDVEVATHPVVILEGVGLGAAALRANAVLTIWVDADAEVRLARVLARDGEQLRAQMTSWQRDENEWHRRDRTRDSADVRITTTP